MKKTIAWMMVAALGAGLIGGCEGPEADDEEGGDVAGDEELGETQQALCIFSSTTPPTTVDDTANLNNSSSPTTVTGSGGVSGGGCDQYVLKVLDASEASHVSVVINGLCVASEVEGLAFVYTRHGTGPFYSWERQTIALTGDCYSSPPFEVYEVSGEADITDTGFNQIVVAARANNPINDDSYTATSAEVTVEE